MLLFQKLILIDYVIGSYYQVEQLRDSLPKDFLQTVVAELQSAEPARQSKSFETPKKKTVPLTFIVSVTPTTDLEIYNDNFNIIAVLTESETFPPVNMSEFMKGQLWKPRSFSRKSTSTRSRKKEHNLF